MQINLFSYQLESENNMVFILETVVGTFLILLCVVGLATIFNYIKNISYKKELAFLAAYEALKSRDLKSIENVLILHGNFLPLSIKNALLSIKDDIIINKY